MTLSDTTGSVPDPSATPGTSVSGATPSGAASSDAGPPGLWNRNFVLLWQGQLVSQLGNQAFAIAIMYWLMETTGSASLMGTIMMTSMLPGVLLGPIGGTIADRHPRVRLIVGSDVIRGVLVLGLFGCLALAPHAHGLVIGMLFVTALVSGIVNAVFMPAIGAAIPDLVPPSRLAAANSLNQFSTQGVMFIGQAIGGILYRVLGAPLLFLIDGVSYLLSALSESFIRIPARDGARGAGRRGAARRGPGADVGGVATGATDAAGAAGATGATDATDATGPDDASAADTAPDAGTIAPWRRALAAYRDDTLEGIRFVWGRTGMRSFLFLAAGVNFLIMPVLVLLPFLVSQQLGAGPAWYGFLLATLGVGTMIGYVVAGAAPIPSSRRPLAIITAFLVVALSLALLGQARATWVALAAFGAVGMGIGLINIFVMTLFQGTTPGEMRGRVMGLVVTMSLSVSPIGMALGGIVGDLTGKNIPLIFGTCGALMALFTLGAAVRTPVRRFLATEVTVG